MDGIHGGTIEFYVYIFFLITAVSNFNFTTLPSVDLSRAIDEGRNINIRFRSLKANDASQLDFAQLVVYANPIRTNTSSPPSPTRVPAIPTSMPGNTSNHTDAPSMFYRHLICILLIFNCSYFTFLLCIAACVGSCIFFFRLWVFLLSKVLYHYVSPLVNVGLMWLSSLSMV